MPTIRFGMVTFGSSSNKLLIASTSLFPNCLHYLRTWFDHKYMINKWRSFESYKKIHRLFLADFVSKPKTARTASSKTFLSHFCVRAEHSMYFTALMSLESARPWWKWKYQTRPWWNRKWKYLTIPWWKLTGSRDFSLSLFTVSTSSRRSTFIFLNSSKITIIHIPLCQPEQPECWDSDVGFQDSTWLSHYWSLLVQPW